MSQYFDNASTTYIYSEVIASIMNTMEINWGNPSNLHSVGLQAKATLESARKQIADMLEVKPTEIIFTSCASESNALAIHGKTTCFCSQYDHHDIKENPITVVQGESFPIIVSTFHDDTSFNGAIYSHTLVCNETGEIFDLKKRIKIAHELGMTVLVDGTQALGNIPVKPYEIGADYMSFSLHKCHAPKGVGILFVKEGAPISPIIFGSQEGGVRGGTENVPLAIGGAIAMKRALKEMKEKEEHCQRLREIIIGMLQASHVDFIVNEGEENIPSILNIAFKGITGDSMMLALDTEGFTVSTGSACTSGDLRPSEVLQAMNVPEEYIQGAIRISMSLENSETDAYNLAKAIILKYGLLKGAE